MRIEVSRPGKPTDHASVKPFTGTILEECLNAHGFESLQEAKGLIEAWRQEYIESHPHRAFYDRTPEELASPVAAYRNSKGMNGAGDSPEEKDRIRGPSMAKGGSSLDLYSFWLYHYLKMWMLVSDTSRRAERLNISQPNPAAWCIHKKPSIF